MLRLRATTHCWASRCQWEGYLFPSLVLLQQLTCAWFGSSWFGMPWPLNCAYCSAENRYVDLDRSAQRTARTSHRQPTKRMRSFVALWRYTGHGPTCASTGAGSGEYVSSSSANTSSSSPADP